MTKTTLRLTALLVALISLPAMAKSPDRTVPLSYSPERIDAHAGILVRVVQGSNERIDIYSRAIDEIICTTSSDDRSILLKRKDRKGLRNLFSSQTKCIAIITTRHPDALGQISCSSGSEVKVDESGIRYRELHLSASSGGEITLRGIAKELWVEASSGGEIEFLGDSPRVSIQASSGAEVQLEGNYRSLSSECSSGAEVEVHGHLVKGDFDISSGGEVHASGTADEVIIDASSGGEFRGKDLTTKFADLDASHSAEITIRCTGRADKSRSSGARIRVLD